MVDMLDSSVAAFCVILCNLIRALRRILTLALLILKDKVSFVRMEELSPRQLAVKQLKEKFVKAMRGNNAEEVLQILNTGKLDIDTVLEVEDPSMVLASYKQGRVKKYIYIYYCLFTSII